MTERAGAGSGSSVTLAYLTGLLRPAPRLLGFVLSERARARKDSAGAFPAARLTPGLVALAALDEWTVAFMKTPGRMPTRDGYAAAAEEMRAAHAVYAARGWLDDPASLHREPPPLERPRIARSRSLPLIEHMRFPSLYEPDREDPVRDRWLAREGNRTAHAWLLRHRGGPRNWIVCLPAFGMGYHAVDLWAFRAMWLHRTLGLNVVIPVAPLHGPRRSGRISGSEFMTYRVVDLVNGFAQGIWDVRRILGWIRASGAGAVGLYGASMGAHVGAMLAGIDPGLACVIAGFPTVDLAALFIEHGTPSLRALAESHGLLGPQAQAVHRLVTPLALPPVVPAERLFVMAGLADRMATPAQAHALWEHWGRPRIAWMNTNHVAFFWSGEVQGFVREALATTGLA